MTQLVKGFTNEELWQKAEYEGIELETEAKMVEILLQSRCASTAENLN